MTVVTHVTQMSDVPAESADDPEQATPCELLRDLAREAAPADFGRGAGAAVTEEDVKPEELDPSDPAFHWHSVVRARGWAQPTLDGSNGGRTRRLGCGATDASTRTLHTRPTPRSSGWAAAVNAHPGPRGFGR
ncbi:hypothetical protein GCM10009740_17460 [Terrabacter terrae]|uniref:Uncharacterized protein n=1 Tax=Terrabacter terrae TaxID=318434 RepID=A0ABN2U4Q0_9MICO